MSSMKKEEKIVSTNTNTPGSSNQSSSNDFVKKLFQMLQEDSYKDVVRWTINGDSFVVLDTNEFTKELLPRHFKHSNFASFVRQLNKYDFHKVKVSNEEKANYIYGDDAWEFKHPDFRMNDIEALENIKRKGPGTKKTIGNDNSNLNQENLRHPCQNSAILSTQNILKEQIDHLTQENINLHKEIDLLNIKSKSLIDNIVAINSINERNFQAMGNLLNILVQSGIKIPPLDFPNPTLVSMQGRPNGRNNMQISQPNPIPSQQQSSHQSQQLPNIPLPNSSNIASTLSPTIISPAKSIMGELPVLPQQTIPPIASSTMMDIRPTQNESPEILQSAKFHVLLVEDDQICIQLCRKFLVKYGCEVTVVTDGLNAITNVEKVKYDLVLMDIVMPNLDGATATSVIRSFDTKTPIIAMTGNIDDNDLVTYLQNGMSDILAKPFTKDDLYSILAKHLLKKSPHPTPMSQVQLAQPPLQSLMSQVQQVQTPLQPLLSQVQTPQQHQIPHIQQTHPHQPNANSDIVSQEINGNNTINNQVNKDIENIQNIDQDGSSDQSNINNNNNNNTNHSNNSNNQNNTNAVGGFVLENEPLLKRPRIE